MIVRFPGLLSAADVEAVRGELSAAAWKDGKASAQGRARAVKNNLVVAADDPASNTAGLLVLERLSHHEGFRAASLPRTVLPLMFCRYDEGMGYGEHLDVPLIGRGAEAMRTDISVTLFLSHPDEYDGGTLSFASDYGEQRVRGELGEAVLYPASVIHRVEPVTRGTRIVAVTWIQSLIRDAGQRRILGELARIASALEAAPDGHEQAMALRKTQFELLRMWSD